MARAVVLDSFASVAVEQVCQKVDEILAEKYSGKYMTFRFSPGYGDYPIEMQKEYLRILDAPRKNRSYNRRQLFACAVKVGYGSSRNFRQSD